MAAWFHLWRKLHVIYGSDEMESIVRLMLQGSVLGLLTCLLCMHFTPFLYFLARSFNLLPIQGWSLVAGFVGGLMGLMSLCFLVTAANLWYCSLVLRWKLAQRMVGMVDWGNVCYALDIGCGSGILLNAVALHLKKERGGGRVVGVDLWMDGEGSCKTIPSTLRNAAMEEVQEYVTCKSGDPRNLPFLDNQFDVVMSALYLHKLGKEDYGQASLLAAAERSKALQEMVRVLRPGGQAIIWDLVNVPEYANKVRELNMQDVHLSECIPAFMMQSHILYFKKPL
eukprot:c24732_g1_i1 orf=738-1583(+)